MEFMEDPDRLDIKEIEIIEVGPDSIEPEPEIFEIVQPIEKCNPELLSECLLEENINCIRVENETFVENRENESSSSLLIAE